MNNFLKYFYELMLKILENIAAFFINLGKNFVAIFNFNTYNKILSSHSSGFNGFEWFLTILTFIILAGILVFLIYLLVMLVKKYVRVRKTYVAQEELVDQIDELNQKIVKLIREKDYLMAMKVSKLGLKPGDEGDDEEDEESRTSSERFVKLIGVDQKYEYTVYHTKQPQNFTLEKLASDLKNFACGELRLFYDDRIIRLFISALSASKLVILEGISGTGKTSLPYAFGKFVKFDTPIIPVQPSWRDKTELIGYLNEFTKRFNETEFLKVLYEYGYRDTVGLVVLDEMNLARIEYYFAEVLSTLEIPNPDERFMDIVPDHWALDPVLLKEGKLKFPSNTWFLGTANNDDSTFTITDKVYDRATAIVMNAKHSAFTPDPYENYEINAKYLESLFVKAKQDFPVSPELIKRLSELDKFILHTFKITFGNRIMKQIHDFLPTYSACGGSEIDALDFFLTTKILRKFNSLNLSYEQDNLKKLLIVFDRLFGPDNMTEAKTFIQRMIKK